MGWRTCHFVALIFCGSLLTFALYQIFTDGNLTIKGHPAQIISTGEALWMLIGFGCSAASAARGLFKEHM